MLVRLDRVDHGILFQKLLNRGLPTTKMRVEWNFSECFTVSNSVRQGSVLSPVLFAIYLDGLLEELSNSTVGCLHWRWLFVGAFCNADGIVLLAPCA